MTEPDITRLLQAVDATEPGALDALMRRVDGDLQRLAARHLARAYGPGAPGVTLEPAALVNESFLRLAKQRRPYENREQFFALASRVMIRVLKDNQKRRTALKRGGDARPVTLSWDPTASETSPSQKLIAVELLERVIAELEALDARKARLVELRVLWEHTLPEIASLLGVSVATAERDWRFVRAWLGRRLEEQGES